MNVMANPLSMFEVAGKVALVTGASGAFGMVAARILAGAGCKLVLAAGNQTALDEIAAECRDMGAKVPWPMRPTLTSGGSIFWWWRPA